MQRVEFGRVQVMSAVLGLWVVTCPGVAAGERPPEPPSSPIDAARGALRQLKSQGKDVSGLEADLARLEPEWRQIAELQKQLHGMMEAFKPKFDRLMEAVPQGRGGMPAETPVLGVQCTLDALRMRGVDIADLQVEFDRLIPEWQALERAEHEAIAAAPEARGPLVRRVEELASPLRSRIQALAERLHARADLPK